MIDTPSMIDTPLRTALVDDMIAREILTVSPTIGFCFSLSLRSCDHMLPFIAVDVLTDVLL